MRGERMGAAVASRATGAVSWQAQQARRLAIELPEIAKQAFVALSRGRPPEAGVAWGAAGKGLGPLVFCGEQRLQLSQYKL